MSKLQYSVKDGILKLPNGKCIEVGTWDWFQWLGSSDANSFRFETDYGCKNYTARREELKSGEFWYAYKKIGGKLHKRYMGILEELGLERLESIAYKLLEPTTPRQKQELPKSVGNSDVRELREMVEEMRRNAFERESVVEQLIEQKVQLQNQLKELHTNVGNSQYLEAQLKERSQQLADTIIQKQKLEGKAKAAEALAIQQSKEISRLDAKLAEALTRKSKPIDPATLFNQLRPLLNRLSDRERRAIQQKLVEIVDN